MKRPALSLSCARPLFCALALAACQQPPGLQSAAPPPQQQKLDALQIGVKLMEQNQPELALDAFNRSMSESGVTPEALTGAATAYHRLGRPGQARRFLESAVSLDSNSAVAHNNLGVSLYDNREYAAALAAFERASDLTGGEDRSVATNLAMAQFAVEMLSDRQAAVDDVDFDVIQYGHGVYRLEPRRKQVARAESFPQ